MESAISRNSAVKVISNRHVVTEVTILTATVMVIPAGKTAFHIAVSNISNLIANHISNDTNGDVEGRANFDKDGFGDVGVEYNCYNDVNSDSVGLHDTGNEEDRNERRWKRLGKE